MIAFDMKTVFFHYLNCLHKTFDVELIHYSKNEQKIYFFHPIPFFHMDEKNMQIMSKHIQWK